MKKEKNGKEIFEEIDSLLDGNDSDYDKFVQMAKDSPNYFYAYIEFHSEYIDKILCKINMVAVILARALSEIKEKNK